MDDAVIAESADDAEVVRGLIRICHHLTGGASWETKMNLLCRETAAVLHCNRSSILLRDGDSFRARFNWGNPPHVAKGFEAYRVPLDAPLMVRMRTERTCVVVNNARQARPTRTIAEHSNIESLVLAPLFDAAGAQLGFMTAEFNQQMGAFNETSAAIVLGVAQLAQAATLLEQAQSAQAEAADIEQALHQRVRLAEDRERKRISRDLHDDPVQQLGGLRLWVEALRANPTAHRPIDESLAAIEAGLGAVEDSLRSVVHAIHPLSLSTGGLESAISDDLIERASTCKWWSKFNCTLDEVVPPPVEMALFRIAQEALRNAEAHSRCDGVEITLTAANGAVSLVIADDGQGFATNSIAPDRFGVVAMQERAADVGGRCSVVGIPGTGTTVTAQIPINSQPAQHWGGSDEELRREPTSTN